MRLRHVLATTVTCLIATGPTRPWPDGRPVVIPNDNRTPAGARVGDTLRVSLVVGLADWYPGSDTGTAIAVAAFSEAGEAPRIPAPLLRVPEGTVLDVTVRNALPDSTIHLAGFHTPSTRPDSLVPLAPGGLTRFRFAAGAPGTYYYAARVGHPSDEVERETAIGAFVVDPAGGAPPDRVFVINIWSDPVDSVTWREALAINGKSFPYNERIAATVGDSVRWRWVNGSIRNHPMHLHGFFFRVDAKGDGGADTTYAPAERRLVVTEDMAPFTTMNVVWSPHRDGNWLFHCHIGFHVAPEAQIDPPAEQEHAHLSGDFERHMAGLVLALVVDPAPGGSAAGEPPRRHLRLYAQEGRPRGRAARALGYVIADDDRVPAPDSVEIPGPTLVLTRGEPTDITIVNRMPEPTAVHWHGLELESYSDGMAGWSGYGPRIAPPVMPADSFTAHLTLERPGTFMYHTHLNDYEQLTAGLYGAIVVLEPGETFDPITDHVFVIGWDGPEPPHLLLNGDSLPPPMALAGGVTHRLRLVNIGMAIRIEFTLLRDSALVSWRPRAWDGADLPPAQASLRAARTVVAVGQTADFLFDPPGPGRYGLVLTAPNGKAVMKQELVVR